MRTRSVVLVAGLAAMLLACRGGAEPADEPAPPAAVPDGWEEHDFGDGVVAAPGDWTVITPIATDDLTLRGPDPGDGLPPIARIQTTGRDGAPFDQLLQLVSAQLNLQFPEVEPGEFRAIDLDGADQAQVGVFTYQTQANGQPVTLEERFVIAWYGDDGQTQLRIGGPAERMADQQATIEQVIGSLRFTAG